MKRRPISLLLMIFTVLPIVLILVSSTSVLALASHQQPLRMELIHRRASQLHSRTITRLELIKELLQNDILRQDMISYKRRLSPSSSPESRREAWEMPSTSNSNTGAIEMPLWSGRDYGIAQYVVEFKVGTPSQKFTVIVDTGSDLTWVNCRYRCDRNCTRQKERVEHRRVFMADRSSSFKTIPCLSEVCKIQLADLFSLTRCPTPITPCAYDYRYLTDATQGIFAKETVSVGLTNGRKTKLQDVLIGCSDSFLGNSFKKTDGVLGLAYSKYSFANKATENYGGKFSYCLVDQLSRKNVSNYLIFGGIKKTKTPLAGNMRYTKLELGLISSFYAVNVVGMSIGSILLKIPIQVWDANRGGGIIIDSGTSLTSLTEPAYNPVMAALQTSVSKYQRIKLNGLPLEHCFNSTGFVTGSVPRLAFHFAGGARFEPHVKSYIIDVAAGVKCLGFVKLSLPGTSVIGNIMQQNYFWEFDLVGSKLGFAPSACT